MNAADAAGKIITFYSYKGGTGRSMALANVAWTLAMNGRRVLTIDWDLEAPGLHRYFQPFIDDPLLENSTGVADFVLEFAAAAVSSTSEQRSKDWYLPHSNLLAHAVPVEWEFPDGGLIDLVPAGRQDSAYAARVNSFDWRAFYEKLGGGVWLEVVKQQLRTRYDYILVDSRTGVSDTSGICTVQMPDELVVCFTLNQQSMRGAAGVATSVSQQRRGADDKPTIKIWPIPMRVESAEQNRLEAARAVARTRFSHLMTHLTPDEEDIYWGEIEVLYYPFYAYEEVLASFADRPRQSRSLLTSVETIVSYITDDGRSPVVTMREDDRLRGLGLFTTASAETRIDELKLLASEYERIRDRMAAGNQRTYLMTSLVGRAQTVAGRHDVPRVAEMLFNLGTDGTRVVGLALARLGVQRPQIEMALSGIGQSRSAFEQYHALLLAEQLAPLLDPTGRSRLRAVVESQMGGSITTSDQSRWGLARKLSKTLAGESDAGWSATHAEPIEVRLGSVAVAFADIHPSSPTVQCDDVDERHGQWLVSRGPHTLQLPRAYRLGIDLVSNELYRQFVDAGGYGRSDFWSRRVVNGSRLLTLDRTSAGPATWPAAGAIPSGQDRHPVSAICYEEAMAFVRWCNHQHALPGWRYELATDDMWEYAARTEARLIYPWGDVFDSAKCNSIESGVGATTEVSRYAGGASRDGCRDLVGNLWEFVQVNESENNVALRGGGFRNNYTQLRSYLRLFGVSRLLRSDDFGMRLAMTEITA